MNMKVGHHHALSISKSLLNQQRYFGICDTVKVVHVALQEELTELARNKGNVSLYIKLQSTARQVTEATT